MEIWKIQQENLDLEKGFVTFSKTKTGITRTVPIRGEALELLRTKIYRNDTPLIFPSKKNSSVAFDFRAPFEAAVKRAGIEDFRWHDLRHSAASYLIRAGINLRIVGEILGHKNISMTMRYSHLAPDHLTDAVEIMTAKFLTK